MLSRFRKGTYDLPLRKFLDLRHKTIKTIQSLWVDSPQLAAGLFTVESRAGLKEAYGLDHAGW
jgi:hypothetical protein